MGNLIVLVKDDGMNPPALTDQANITVIVTDVNEPPDLFDMSCQVTESEDRSRREQANIRLSGGKNGLSGILEYNVDGTWGLVCNDNFASSQQFNAKIACEQLGLNGGMFLGSLSLFPDLQKDTSLIPTIGNISCSGEEKRLSECSGFSKVVEGCTKDEAVVLQCENPWKQLCLLTNFTDPDAEDSHIFSIVGGNVGQPHGLFAVSSKQLQVNDFASSITRASFLDYEIHANFELVIKIVDSEGLDDLGGLHIDLIDINESPYFRKGDKLEAIRINENLPIFTPIAPPIDAIDADVEDQGKLRYYLGEESEYFYVDKFSGQLFVSKVVSFEVHKALVIELVVQDTANLTDTIIVPIEILDVNEVPIGNETDVYIQENANDGDGATETPLGRTAILSAVDEDYGEWGMTDFEIVRQVGRSQSGWDDVAVFRVEPVSKSIVVSGISPLDYEVYSEYVVTIKVVDKGLLSSTFEVGVNVLDVNENPVFVQISRQLLKKILSQAQSLLKLVLNMLIKLMPASLTIALSLGQMVQPICSIFWKMGQ